MNMNQGFSKIILVIAAVFLIGGVGYFTIVKKVPQQITVSTQLATKTPIPEKRVEKHIGQMLVGPTQTTISVNNKEGKTILTAVIPVDLKISDFHSFTEVGNPKCFDNSGIIEFMFVPKHGIYYASTPQEYIERVKTDPTYKVERIGNVDFYVFTSTAILSKVENGKIIEGEKAETFRYFVRFLDDGLIQITVHLVSCGALKTNQADVQYILNSIRFQ